MPLGDGEGARGRQKQIYDTNGKSLSMLLPFFAIFSMRNGNFYAMIKQQWRYMAAITAQTEPINRAKCACYKGSTVYMYLTNTRVDKPPACSCHLCAMHFRFGSTVTRWGMLEMVACHVGIRTLQLPV